MKIASKEISVEQHHFILTNQRAMFWEKYSALVISDLHIGKTAHFRKNGIAIPNYILHKDLQRLSFLIQYFSAKHIYINGDLLHAGNNSDVDIFKTWLQDFPLISFHLIEGNHDKNGKDIFESLGFNSVQKRLEINNIVLVHEFEKTLDKFQITGHIHPGIVLASRIKKLKLPAFVLNDRQLLLPAFSEFTGLDLRDDFSDCKRFPFHRDAIFEF